MTTTTALITDSQNNDRIARAPWSQEIADSLLSLCDDSVAADELEIWGEDDCGEWRVHLTGDRDVHELTLDLDSVDEYEDECDNDDDEPEHDDLSAYISLLVRRGATSWRVGTMVGVPEASQGTARAAGTPLGMLRAWQIDHSDLQAVPEHLLEAVVGLLTHNAVELWDRVTELRDA